MCEQLGYSDSREVCGTCGISYRRRYERGRRMLDMMRPGEKQLRLNKVCVLFEYSPHFFISFLLLVINGYSDL